MIKWFWRTVFRKSYQSIFEDGKKAAFGEAALIMKSAIQMAAVSGQTVEECARAIKGLLRYER